MGKTETSRRIKKSMVARELRIGNLVVRHNGAIITVNSELLAYLEKYPNEKFMSNPPMDAIASIPLTEEWLLKFGFYDKGGREVNCYEKYTHVFCYGEDDVIQLRFTECCYGGIEEKYVTFYYNDNALKSVSYIHEVQNLTFELTGEELTIKD